MLAKQQIADLSSLRAEMHKFEACYIDNLVGEYWKHVKLVMFIKKP